VNSVRREAGRHFRNEKKEYAKDQINELATRNKNKNIEEWFNLRRVTNLEFTRQRDENDYNAYRFPLDMKYVEKLLLLAIEYT
jgi:hypothetical protein